MDNWPCSANIKLLNGRGSLAAEVASQLRLLRISGVTIRADLDALVSMGEALRSHISKIDREMRTMAASIPACARFQTIPGVSCFDTQHVLPSKVLDRRISFHIDC